MSSSHGGGPINLIATPVHILDGWGLSSKIFLVIVGLGLGIFTFTLFDFKLNAVFSYAFALAPIWLPFVTFILFFENWLWYVRKEYNIAKQRVTLEIKLPQEILKSPQAMELVLIQLHQTASPDNHIQTYIDGKHPPKYGLEIVSRGGDVRFYINVQRAKTKNIAETQLYAQYPGIEVHELDIDYTAEIPWDPSRYSYFSLHFGLTEPDAYPIKTYIDYELDRMPDEDEKIDPITSVIETLGNIGPDENIWVQILIDAHRKVEFKTGSLSFHPDWKEQARAEIKKIIEGAVKRAGAEESKGNVMQLLTETEKDTVKAIERSIGKIAFNSNIRCMYIAKKDSYQAGERIGAIITMWRAYEDQNRNKIGFQWRTDFDWNWWQDPHGHHAEAYKRQELNEYKRRYYTSHSTKDTSKVMTTEELATIFHFPGKVASTPSLARIPSKRSEPPANLPTN